MKDETTVKRYWCAHICLAHMRLVIATPKPILVRHIGNSHIACLHPDPPAIALISGCLVGLTVPFPPQLGCAGPDAGRMTSDDSESQVSHMNFYAFVFDKVHAIFCFCRVLSCAATGPGGIPPSLQSAASLLTSLPTSLPNYRSTTLTLFQAPPSLPPSTHPSFPLSISFP